MHDEASTLDDIRLNPSLQHIPSTANILAKKKNTGYRARCVLCCAECHRPKVPKHSNSWGYKTTSACLVCKEFLCTKPRWDGDSCFHVWHTLKQLPRTPCEELNASNEM
mmetsp:Transcript_11135/g.14538  ORF Transcript_11135/g.14538 Transcript_11135/m.14538 type:complete len:109 (-) Transcript_11135:217-543(-)